MLSSMPPYSEVVCCVCTTEHRRRSALAAGSGRRAVRARPRCRPVLGIARSDPYLCSASAAGELPLRGTTRASSLGYALRAALAREVPAAGAILLALPMQGRPSRTGRHEWQRRRIVRALQQQQPWCGGSGGGRRWRGRVPLIAWDARASLIEASLELRTNILWQGVGSLHARARPWVAKAIPTSGRLAIGSTRANAPTVDVQAAVALQCLLDAETGGWPNTFG